MKKKTIKMITIFIIMLSLSFSLVGCDYGYSYRSENFDSIISYVNANADYEFLFPKEEAVVVLIDILLEDIYEFKGSVTHEDSTSGAVFKSRPVGSAARYELNYFSDITGDNALYDASTPYDIRIQGCKKNWDKANRFGVVTVFDLERMYASDKPYGTKILSKQIYSVENAEITVLLISNGTMYAIFDHGETYYNIFITDNIKDKSKIFDNMSETFILECKNNIIQIVESMFI